MESYISDFFSEKKTEKETITTEWSVSQQTVHSMFLLSRGYLQVLTPLGTGFNVAFSVHLVMAVSLSLMPLVNVLHAPSPYSG